MSFISAGNRLARLADRRIALVLPLWLAAFLAVVIPLASRPLWYDELFTYYEATAPDLHQAYARLIHTDANPPLEYLLVRGSIALFGDSPLAVRIPSVAAFLCASLVLFAVVRKRLGAVYGLTALGFLWSTIFMYYAAEARSYALLLAFSSIAMACWLRAAGKGKVTWAHGGLSASLAGMLLSHCFAAASIGAFILGQAVHDLRARTADRWSWIALMLPLPAVTLYLPLFHNVKWFIYPPAFQASWRSLAAAYLAPLGPVILLLLIVLLCLPRPPGGATIQELATPDEMAFVAGTLLVPLTIVLALMWAKVAFWPRYGIVSALGVSLLLTFLVAYKSNRAPWAGVLAAVLLLGNFCAVHHILGGKPERLSTAYREILPDLPFVAASGLTFMEMDHREPAGFVSRLHYLTDREAATRYAHATIFETFPVLRQWFPIRATVEPYREFVVRHDCFLVIATPGYPEDWLLDKLKDDGAELRLLEREATGYKDRDLFLVSLKGANCPRTP
ncbi:conserved membrane hypothetical protein [Acidobacteriia bacterium SbA2]|nr:conserved membrane hypothetical protein [Acidobacteriia bacterium SbA2]